MKPTKPKTLARTAAAFATICLFSASLAHAGGNEGAHGDDYLLLKDDTVKLADPFVVHHGSANELAAELKEELKRIGSLLVSHGAASPYEMSKSGQGQAAFIRNQVLNELVEYRFVPKLPDLPECIHRQTLESKAGLVKRRGGIGCTIGMVTWIVESWFKRLSLREQALLIVHERLHALPDDAAHELITDLLAGLDLALDLFDAEVNGAQPILSQSQISALKTMVRRITQLGLGPRGEGRFVETGDFAPKCGGMISRSTDSKISDEACLGIGSYLQGSLTGPITVVATRLEGVDVSAKPLPEGRGRPLILFSVLTSWMGANAPLSLEEEAVIVQSSLSLESRCESRVSSGASVRDSSFGGESWCLRLGHASRVSDSILVNSRDISLSDHGSLMFALGAEASIARLPMLRISSRSLADPPRTGRVFPVRNGYVGETGLYIPGTTALDFAGRTLEAKIPDGEWTVLHSPDSPPLTRTRLGL